ncbi:MAG: M24 family metallopeptidase [Aggregatilineaceae bacterium]
MKSDLDRLMAERAIDALLILPGENEDPYRTYLSNGAQHGGLVLKRCGQLPVLIVNSMERDEAARSGLPVYVYDDFGHSELLRTYQDDRDAITTTWYSRIFDEFGVGGRVGLYGVTDLNHALRVVRILEKALSDRIQFVTETVRDTIFDRAYETKDPAELTRLRDVARRTSAVACATRDWLASHRAAEGLVVQGDGQPLRIGAVKRHVRGLLFAEGLLDSEGMIFAQGRDAAIPHSKGADDEPLRLGTPIVFDLFPREPGGYFHDMTRTWCLGYAPPEVQAVYQTVMEAFRRAQAMCAPGVSTSAVQRMVCEFFEAAGHPTVLHTPATTDGYTHSLAHGVGLNVHEAPYFPTFSDRYTLQAGNVFTIEPGLYYAGRGLGVRIEDTVYLNETGQLEILTAVPYDLIIHLES